MISLAALLDSIWHTPNRQLAWGRISTGHVIGSKAPDSFKANNDYVIVRLGSMFLKDSRVLWLKLSPLAHATVDMSSRTVPRSDTAVVGPAQFGDLAAAPGDRTLILNQRLSGPRVWRGGDLNIAAGLFAVPKDQAAATLLDTLGQLAGLGIPGLKEAGQIAEIVKSGVEGLIGLNGTKPVLGVKVALADPQSAAAGTEAAPCVLAGIAAPATEVNFDNLWIRDGRLLLGASAAALQPYERHDHFLIVIERGPPREDWRGLPALGPHEAEFDAALRASGVDRKDTETKLNEIFSGFDADLTGEAELTDPDKDRIRGEVIAELNARLERKYAGPIGKPAKETRSVAGIRREVDPEGFNFLDVGDGGLEGAKPAKVGTRPF
jgi:hypothetical protein